MKTDASHVAALVVLAALPAAVMLSSGCSSLPKGETTKQVITKEGVPGAYAVETFKTTATVTAVDKEKRKVTVVSKDGKKRELKAGPEVANFDQIAVGDQVVVTVSEELLVYMASEGLPRPDGAAAVVAAAPQGAKPGMLVAGTAQVTAKVVGLDRATRKAMLQLPDGTTKTFTVRQDVDLSKRSIGEEVVFRCTEAVAIRVEKP